jgi:phosphotransferase system IIB component
MQYTNGTETVDAIAWSNDFSQILTFLQDNPPVLDPKVLEDNPAALGVIEQDGDLVVFVGGDAVFQHAHLGDFLVRGANLKLRAIDQTTFTATFTPVTP